MKSLMKGFVQIGLCIGLLIGSILGIAYGIVYFVGINYQTVLFIAAIMAIFIGGIGSIGESRRRTDFEYLHMRSMSAQSNIEQIEREKRDNDIQGKFQVSMMVVGIILVVIACNIG